MSVTDFDRTNADFNADRSIAYLEAQRERQECIERDLKLAEELVDAFLLRLEGEAGDVVAEVGDEVGAVTGIVSPADLVAESEKKAAVKAESGLLKRWEFLNKFATGMFKKMKDNGSVLTTGGHMAVHDSEIKSMFTTVVGNADFNGNMSNLTIPTPNLFVNRSMLRRIFEPHGWRAEIVIHENSSYSTSTKGDLPYDVYALRLSPLE